MKENLKLIKERAIEELKKVNSTNDIESIKIKYLGKKGELTGILRGMGGLPNEERPIIGKLANEVRESIELYINNVAKNIKETERLEKLSEETIDISLPGKKQIIGKRHPLDLTLESMKEIFMSMGFSIEESPEVELDYYNFEALNIPKNHPARSEQDTFYINEKVVLRTQTSPSLQNTLTCMIQLPALS